MAEKQVTVGIRVPESLRLEMEDVAYLTDRKLTELIIAGVRRELDAVRAEYGEIPPRPRRRAAEPHLGDSDDTGSTPSPKRKPKKG